MITGENCREEGEKGACWIESYRAVTVVGYGRRRGRRSADATTAAVVGRVGLGPPSRRRSRSGKPKGATVGALRELLREPQVGIEPTTARLRIECSTPELLWHSAAAAECHSSGFI